MIQKILPFLNDLLPAGLAIKGLSKVDPRISNFISTAGLAGYGTSQILDYLKSQISNPAQEGEERNLAQRASQGNIRADESERLRHAEGQGSGAIPGGAALLGGTLSSLLGSNQEQQPLASQQEQIPEKKEKKNQFEFLNLYSPELYQKVNESLLNGIDLETISRALKADKKFSSIISKIENDTGLKFNNLLNQFLGKISSQSIPANTPQANTANTDRLSNVIQAYMQVRGKK